jgi:Bax protein
MLADRLATGRPSVAPADEVVARRRPPIPHADHLGAASLSLALLRDAPDGWRSAVDRLAPAPVRAPLDAPARRIAVSLATAPDRLITAVPLRTDTPPARRAVARADRLVPSPLTRAVRVAALSDETAWSALSRPWSSEPLRPELLPTARPSPAVLLARWLPELSSPATTADLKTQFVRQLLPLVMQVNEEILQRRARVIALAPRLAVGETLSESDTGFVAGVLQETRIEAWDADELLLRLDAVPLSMALAQAAQESGWGRSRPAREDNALFGQMMFAAAARPQVQPFTDLLETVTAYARNLNSHWAYREFRRRRAALRARGDALDGHALVPFIQRYSERGLGYVEAIRQLMRMNNLFALDVRVLDAALGGPTLEGPTVGPALDGAALDPDRIVADPIGAIGPAPRRPAQGMDN